MSQSLSLTGGPPLPQVISFFANHTTPLLGSQLANIVQHDATPLNIQHAPSHTPIITPPMQLIAAPTPMSGIATLFNLIQLQIEAITCNHDEIFTIQVEIHERHSLE